MIFLHPSLVMDHPSPDQLICSGCDLPFPTGNRSTLLYHRRICTSSTVAVEYPLSVDAGPTQTAQVVLDRAATDVRQFTCVRCGWVHKNTEIMKVIQASWAFHDLPRLYPFPSSFTAKPAILCAFYSSSSISQSTVHHSSPQTSPATPPSSSPPFTQAASGPSPTTFAALDADTSSPQVR